MIREYIVTKDYKRVLKVFTNLKEAKVYAKQKAIEVVDRTFVDLYSDESGVYQFSDTICTYDPMGELVD